jgi:hypothetical protein
MRSLRGALSIFRVSTLSTIDAVDLPLEFETHELNIPKTNTVKIIFFILDHIGQP